MSGLQFILIGSFLVLLFNISSSLSGINGSLYYIAKKIYKKEQKEKEVEE